MASKIGNFQALLVVSQAMLNPMPPPAITLEPPPAIEQSEDVCRVPENQVVTNPGPVQQDQGNEEQQQQAERLAEDSQGNASDLKDELQNKDEQDEKIKQGIDAKNFESQQTEEHAKTPAQPGGPGASNDQDHTGGNSPAPDKGPGAAVESSPQQETGESGNTESRSRIQAHVDEEKSSTEQAATNEASSSQSSTEEHTEDKGQTR